MPIVTLRRLLALTILLVALVACGEDGGDQAAPDVTQTPQTEAGTRTEPTATPQEPTASDSEGAPRTEEAPPMTEGSALHGDWYLTDAEGVEGLPLPDRDLTLTVEADTLAGNAGCNSYSAGYTLDGESVSIAEVISTRMACDPPELLQAEDAFLAALEAVTRMTRVGEELVLEGAGATLRFTALSLPDEGTSEGAGGLPGAPDTN